MRLQLLVTDMAHSIARQLDLFLLTQDIFAIPLNFAAVKSSALKLAALKLATPARTVLAASQNLYTEKFAAL